MIYTRSIRNPRGYDEPDRGNARVYYNNILRTFAENKTTKKKIDRDDFKIV